MPNRAAFAQVITQARRAANQAARTRFAEIAGNPLWSECGGTHISLEIEDLKWQRFFDLLIEKPLSDFTVRKSGANTYFVSILRCENYQEVTVALAAAHEILKILEAETNGKGKLRGYLS